ncbi:MAG: O-methyltransferase [Bryobacterales bacterium]|nr:O-methyltransferase [Bryobacterales bacterium]
MRQVTLLSFFSLGLATLACGQGRMGRGTSPDALEHPPLPHSDLERRVLSTLSDMVKAGDLYANVPASDGRFLRQLAEASNAKVILEIGTSTGISGLWFALALDKTGGKLTTFEIDPRRAASARSNFKKAGVDRLITIVEGDAHKNIAQWKEPIDIVFIDADKDGYVDYLNKLLPLVKPGGLLLAHNMDMVPDYIRAVTTNPALDTTFYTSGGGMAVTLKKR